MPRRPSRSKVTTSVQSWWIGGGDEECPHCGQLYAFELQVHCVDCDAPICLHCVAIVQGRKLCAGCIPAEGR